MAWVAGKRQRVKRNGEYVWVEPGEPIPEAEHWPNQESWERQGFIRRIGKKVTKKKEVVVRRTNALTKKRAVPVEKPVEAAPEAVEPAPEPASEPLANVTSEVPEAAPEAAPEATQKLSGPGPCPGCGKDFLQLEKHVCKGKP